MDFKIENKIIKLQPRSNKLPIPGRVSQKSERFRNPGDELDEPRHFGTTRDFFKISGSSGIYFEINVAQIGLRGTLDIGLKQLDQGSKRDLNLGSIIVHSGINR